MAGKGGGSLHVQTWQLVRMLVFVCFLAMSVMAFVEMVYLPQQRLLLEAHDHLAELEKQVARLPPAFTKGGSEEGKQNAFEHERLRRRQSILEEALGAAAAALDRHAPGSARELRKALKKAEEEDKVEKEAKGEAPETGAPAPEALALAWPAPAKPAAKAPQAPQAPPTPRTRAAAAAVGASAAASAEGTLATPTGIASTTARRWREDNRCGSTVPMPGGGPTECDPDGDFSCCGASGWCGNTEAHCKCQGCKDYGKSNALAEKILETQIREYDWRTPKDIALIVPFRDRWVHLERFRERIQDHVEAWNKKGVGHRFTVFIVEQFDNALFNRGYLFNAGFKLVQAHMQKTEIKFDCVVMQDIDILPTPVVDYGWCIWPNQIAGEIECWQWAVPYVESVGGVVSLSPTHWKQINGFSNEYDGWGGEDDDMYHRLRQNTLLKGGCHTWCKDIVKARHETIFRPKLGSGRFTCLHDGDHTPRQRSDKDAGMWSRLEAMGKNSDRWKRDGISNLVVHEAGEQKISLFCNHTACQAHEDPQPRLHLFAEVWARLSQQPVPDIGRVRVSIESCGNVSRALKAIPAGVEDLRAMLVGLFADAPSSCKVDDAFARAANVVAVDLGRGRAVLIGHEAPMVTPDSALPPIPEAGAQAKPESMLVGSERMVQGQRLSKWLRQLASNHQGLLFVPQQRLPSLRSELIALGRRWPQAAPACISESDFSERKRKYRLTPGTQWCGDGGWTHAAHFNVLRAASSVPASDVLPICVSYNAKVYTYRFDQSETGCIGTHSSGTVWKHAATIHTSKKAQGARMCVGIAEQGQHTRWSIMKAESCTQGSYRHVFGFYSMDAQHSAPLTSACLLLHPSGLRRLAVAAACTAASDGWLVDRSLIFLAVRTSQKDHQICTADGVLEAESKLGVFRKAVTAPSGATFIGAFGGKAWRTFRDSVCKKHKVVTREISLSNHSRMHWSIATDSIFVPPDGTGPHLCHCRVLDSETPSYTWNVGGCPAHAVKELCFHELTDRDVIRYSYLLDEVV